MSKSTSKNIGFLAGIGVLMIALIGGGIALTKNLGKSNREVTRENAIAQLDKKLKKIQVFEAQPRKAAVEIAETNLAAELPDINKYPLSVTGRGTVNIEIFSSTEKSSSGTDGWLNEVAEKFNSSRYEIDGQWATVSVRPIASGAAIDYMISGKYLPEAYSPSNELWGEMIAAENVKIEKIEDRLAGNTAGILVSKKTYDTLKQEYGEVNISSVVDATVKSKITMGYTNPYASSTGMNFLVAALEEFDSTDILSQNAIEKFRKFQQNVPFVAYTTLQMRDAASKGVLDAFLMEYQGYYNVRSELHDYEYIPFGVRHDSPLYVLSDEVSGAQKQLAKAFADYCLTPECQSMATKYGFNGKEEYRSAQWGLDGKTLESAQKLWKTEKDAGSPVMAVFVADVSGSMAGVPLQNLQSSLINASQYINETNYVGLISYSDDVTINLPINKFDLNHRSYFTGAVEDLSPTGSTATYDAVLVALNMLKEAQEKVQAETGQTIKPLLFVLSDGETNTGCDLSDIRPVVEGLKVPCYTIGYNANLNELKKLSEINEAASINADSEDVIYSLKSLFNAQM
ncbi:MAG: VWA domain-containing protein [Oscillospiraceae bacterium]|nr:VWA domain-containing protein [Oscillospiraceae bacterium]